MTEWVGRIAALVDTAGVVIAASGCSATTTGNPTQGETMTSVGAPAPATGKEDTVTG